MTENLKTIPDSITSLVALPADGLKSATVNAGLQQALKLVAVLQTTLNVEKVIKLFAQELRAVLEHKVCATTTKPMSLPLTLARLASIRAPIG